MRARIPHLGRGELFLDFGGLDVIVPDGRAKVEDSFQLNLFTLSKTTAIPLEQVTVSWSISPKSADVDVGKFSFTLHGPDENKVEKLALVGSTTIRPRETSFVHLKGRKEGSSTSPLGEPMVLTVDQENCRRAEILREFFDVAITEHIGVLTRGAAEIRLRGSVTSHWTDFSIRYDLPFKLAINNYFDADLDVSLTIRFQLEHGDDSSVLDVSIRDDVDADFSTFEDIASLGSSTKTAGLIERIVPLILDCPLRLTEASVIRQILSYPPVRQALNDGMRLLSVRPVPLPGFEHVAIVLCPVPDDSGGLSRGGVVNPT